MTLRADNSKELAVRSALHATKCRFRVHYPVPSRSRRSIDIALVGIKLAVFIDGCFWHSCPIHGSSPKANSKWWELKLDANRVRDRDTEKALINAQWHVLRFWEHVDNREIVHRILTVREALAK